MIERRVVSISRGLVWLIMFVSLAAAHAGVYKWTDAQGRTQYSDTPPLTAKSTRLKLQSFSGAAQVSPIASADNGVTIYTAEWCGVCKRAKAFLAQNAIPFREWDVEKTDYGATKFQQLGGSGVPLITVGAKKMAGFSAETFMAMWKKSQPKPQAK